MHALLVTVSLLPLVAAQPSDLAPLRSRHAQALTALGRRALDQQLFNDAERLLGQALAWDPETPGAEGNLDELAAMLRSRAKDPARAEYSEYLASKAFRRARGELREAEAAVLERTSTGLLERALSLLHGDDDPLAMEALHLAFDLGLAERELERAVGGSLAEAAFHSWQEGRGLQRLELGERISGPQVTLDDLEGKVVLWRNFSL